MAMPFTEAVSVCAQDHAAVPRGGAGDGLAFLNILFHGFDPRLQKLTDLPQCRL
jgi:hypothetical protein